MHHHSAFEYGPAPRQAVIDFWVCMGLHAGETRTNRTKTSSYMVSSCPPNKTTIPPEIFKPQGVLSLQTQIHFTQCAGLLFASPGDPPGIHWQRVRRVQPRRPAAHRAAGSNYSNPRLPKGKHRPQGGAFLLVTRRGFEPRTHCLKGNCSAC